jgi:hypothetical protein
VLSRVREIHELVGLTFDDLEITSHLGEGGMGFAYVGRQNSLQRDVCIKFLKPEHHAFQADEIQTRHCSRASFPTRMDDPTFAE